MTDLMERRSVAIHRKVVKMASSLFRMVSAPRRTLTRIMIHLDRRRPSELVIRLMLAVAPSDPGAQSAVLHATLAHLRPTARNIGRVHELARGLPACDLLSALTAGTPPLTRERLELLSTVPAESLPGLDYARASLERRFGDAYAIWREIFDVDQCLDALPMPTHGGRSRTMAVVLPGPADSNYGSDIDDHDLVGRTGWAVPETHEMPSVGSRLDVAFLNWNRYRDITLATVPLTIDADRIVVDATCRSIDLPIWFTHPIEYTLQRVQTPTCPRTYMPLRIVPWCIERDIAPTLYCADFYLGASPYHSTTYDSKQLLATSENNIVSYLRHDVFFNHAALRRWRDHGVIHTTGRLNEILDFDGAEFARALENRWAGK